MPRNYSQFFAILKKLGLDYKDVVAEFTEGRTESLSSLSDGEYKELTLRMQRYNQYDPNDPANKMRRKMIAIARQMRWGEPHPRPLSRGEGSTNALMERLDNWCIKYGKYGKKLNSHTVAELSLLVTIFEEVLDDYLKALQK